MSAPNPISAPGSTVPRLALRIARKKTIATDIALFRLEDPAGAALPPHTPGAHIPVMTPTGLLRKYSLCNGPPGWEPGAAAASLAGPGCYEIAVRRERNGRGGSQSLLDHTAEGDQLLVGEPENTFELTASSAGYLFIAGGIGITPILGMLRALEQAGIARYRLVYLSRTPAATAFREELTDPTLGGRVTLHYDGGSPARWLDLWPLLETPRGLHLYCCGPRALMQEVRDMTGHWPSSAVHFEAFTEAPRNQPDDRAFRVRLARAGAVIDVPVGTSILEALRAAGFEHRSSCESGSCGTCRTTLLAGEPEHRDFVLGVAERDRAIMICVSRARSPELVLDL